jgi:hypothetical protein
MTTEIKIDRKLPPHELNARRRRKRNLNSLPNVDLTGKPVNVPMPHVKQAQPIPGAKPGSPATQVPVSDRS